MRIIPDLCFEQPRIIIDRIALQRFLIIHSIIHEDGIVLLKLQPEIAELVDIVCTEATVMRGRDATIGGLCVVADDGGDILRSSKGRAVRRRVGPDDRELHPHVVAVAGVEAQGVGAGDGGERGARDRDGHRLVGEREGQVGRDQRLLDGEGGPRVVLPVVQVGAGGEGEVRQRDAAQQVARVDGLEAVEKGGVGLGDDEVGEGDQGVELVEDAGGWRGPVVEEEDDEEVDQGGFFRRDDDGGFGVVVGGDEIVGGVDDGARGRWAASVSTRTAPDQACVVGLNGIRGNDS